MTLKTPAIQGEMSPRAQASILAYSGGLAEVWALATPPVPNQVPLPERGGALTCWGSRRTPNSAASPDARWQ
jgi:hypothetical protein